jgi:hypothetical protein
MIKYCVNLQTHYLNFKTTFMRPFQFQVNYKRVYAKTIDLLRDRGMKLISHSHETGLIEASRRKTFLRAELIVTISIKKQNEFSTEIIVNTVQEPHWLRMSSKKLNRFEKSIIGTLEGRL